MQVPEYLYHYTGINTLGFILQNKTIRFTCLTQVDDKDEAIFDKCPDGKYTFVSCWTDKDDESIPMWQMYSQGMRGIRIKMKSCPFLNCGNNRIKISDKYQHILSPFPSQKDILIPVEYLSIEDWDAHRSKRAIETKKSTTKFLTESHHDGIIGIKKSKYWDFQQEWRYKINFMSDGLTGEYKDLDFKYCDAYLSDDALQTMEILLGPHVNEIDEKIVKLLCADSHFPEITVSKSSLTNRV